MKHTLRLLTALLFAPLAALHAAADLVLVEKAQPLAEIVVAEKRPRMTTLAALRQRHTLRGTARLGVPAENVIFLGYPDGGLDKIYRQEGTAPFRQRFTEKSTTYGSVVPQLPHAGSWPLCALHQSIHRVGP